MEFEKENQFCLFAFLDSVPLDGPQIAVRWPEVAVRWPKVAKVAVRLPKFGKVAVRLWNVSTGQLPSDRKCEEDFTFDFNFTGLDLGLRR